ncbi:MAG: hypothetical protein KA242_04755 [Chitinophagales bacterium]|mgnify:FL=1|nr:hypothetical protein [Chitinophagales bacterium]
MSSTSASLSTLVASCFIHQGKLVVNGNVVYTAQAPAQDFFAELYTLSGANYPKFYKMDAQSQLAFLCAEFLLKDNAVKDTTPFDWSVVLSCANSSNDTDIKYWENARQAPSPAAFVYTLPNVMLGEICIRHGFKGENSCFIFNTFDTTFQVNYVNSLLAKRAKVCVHGWVNFFKEEYAAFLFLTVNNGETEGELHSPELINKTISNYAGID